MYRCEGEGEREQMRDSIGRSSCPGVYYKSFQSKNVPYGFPSIQSLYPLSPAEGEGWSLSRLSVGNKAGGLPVHCRPFVHGSPISLTLVSLVVGGNQSIHR
ncbi:unnamed protein product [Boreogadus saida]